MSLSLDAIEAVLQRPERESVAAEETWGRTQRTEALRDVLATLQQLVNETPETAGLVAQKLADASRDESWRLSLGESGILETLLSALSTDQSQQQHLLKLHTLRLVGNSCADTDVNRERVIASGHLPLLVSQIADDQLLPFAVQVLYNLMVDYEPAQLATSDAGLGTRLIDLVSGPRLAQSQNLLGMIGNLLEILVSQKSELERAPARTPIVLLGLALDSAVVTDPAEFVQLTSVALSYLSSERLQTELLESGNTSLLLECFDRLSTYLEPSRLGQGDDGEDLSAQISQVRSTFMQLLADICYLPSFASVHPLDSPVLQTFQAWLEPTAGTSLQAAACLCLGNVARSDEASVALVSINKIHEPAMDLVTSQLELVSDGTHPQDALLLHSALSLLKNLAIPLGNKPQLSSLLAPPSLPLPKIWSLDPNSSIQTPHLHFASVSLARLLVTSTSHNVDLLCAPLSSDSDETPFHRLLALFATANPESAAHTKTEAARAALAVVRVLHGGTATITTSAGPEAQAPPGSDRGSVSDPARRETFYRQHEATLAPALAHLVTQTKFPVLRSEAWFVLALLSRTRDGAAQVVRVLQVPGAWDALVESVTGREGPGAQNEQQQQLLEADPASSGEAAAMVNGLGLEPQQAETDSRHAAAATARVDRENGLVLVSELAKNNGGDGVPASWREPLEWTLRKGGQAVLEARNFEDATDNAGDSTGPA